MNLTDAMLTPGAALWAHLVYWPLLAWAAWRAPWQRVQGRGSHVLFGAAVAVMLAWTLQAGLDDGLRLHMLGATLLTLMFGWHLAVVASFLVVLGVTIDGGAHAGAGSAWLALPLNALLLGLVPVTVSHGLYRLADRRLPNHFFVYIFLSAFFGAAVALGTAVLASTLVHAWLGVYSHEYLVYNYLRYFPLLAFPEAFITGMLMTVFVLFRPGWVWTFDDARYLHGR